VRGAQFETDARLTPAQTCNTTDQRRPVAGPAQFGEAACGAIGRDAGEKPAGGLRVYEQRG
jgi:hypothetical protein